MKKNIIKRRKKSIIFIKNVLYYYNTFFEIFHSLSLSLLSSETLELQY
jgi:hypothetical protein